MVLKRLLTFGFNFKIKFSILTKKGIYTLTKHEAFIVNFFFQLLLRVIGAGKRFMSRHPGFVLNHLFDLLYTSILSISYPIERTSPFNVSRELEKFKELLL